jgi:hypothetical protein
MLNPQPSLEPRRVSSGARWHQLPNLPRLPDRNALRGREQIQLAAGILAERVQRWSTSIKCSIGQSALALPQTPDLRAL